MSEPSNPQLGEQGPIEDDDAPLRRDRFCTDHPEDVEVVDQDEGVTQLPADHVPWRGE